MKIGSSSSAKSASAARGGVLEAFAAANPPPLIFFIFSPLKHVFLHFCVSFASIFTIEYYDHKNMYSG